MFSNIYNNPDAIHWNNLLMTFRISSNKAVTTLALAKALRFSSLQFSWAGDKLRMSTSRHLRKYRGSSPSMQKRCPLALCCCTSLDYKFLPRTVYDPRCENSPGLQQKLAWHRILLRACPVTKHSLMWSKMTKTASEAEISPAVWVFLSQPAVKALITLLNLLCKKQTATHIPLQCMIFYIQQSNILLLVSWQI